MEREGRSHYHTRGSGGGVAYNHNGEPDLLLQWGNRKRLRCVKIQRRDDGSDKAPTASATAVRVGRRGIRADKESAILTRLASPPHQRVLRYAYELFLSFSYLLWFLINIYYFSGLRVC